MATTEGGAVSVYCAGLAAAVRRLSSDLSIPRIEQELYADLFIAPLEEQQCTEHSTSAASSTSNAHASASDMQAEALVSLGATELLKAALEAHERHTLQVLQAVALRESVLTRMRACCAAFDDSTASASEEARFTLLRLLQEHQLVTLLVVESIFEWREVLSRPYPFHLRTGDNYLLSIVDDCAALDTQPLVRSLSTVRLRQDPLCAKVDLQRMLHRLETTRRSRLITTGALWNVGLEPLRPLQARGRSQSAEVRSVRSGSTRDTPSRAKNGSAPPKLRTPLPRPPTTPQQHQQQQPAPPKPRSSDAARFSRFHGGRPEDFVGEVARLNGALKRRLSSSGSQHNNTSSAVSATSLSLSAAMSSSSFPARSSAASFSLPHPPLGESMSVRQRQHRLLTATRVIETEATLQRTVLRELHRLVTVQGRFVPLLDIPQLFSSLQAVATTGEAMGGGAEAYPADSWPLDRALWHATATAESRVDRLSCMSTAREALGSAGLLPEWQHRMGRRASGLSGPSASLSKGSATTGSSTPADGTLTPLKPEARESRYSDSFEHTSPASTSAQGLDTRLPMLAAAEELSSSSSASSSSSSSSSRPSASADPPPQAAEGVSGQQPDAYSDDFSSDFESESTSSDDDSAAAAAPPAGQTGESSEDGNVNEAAAASSPSASPAASSLSSTPKRLSHRPSLDELREQLLAEHRLNTSLPSHSS